MARTKHLDRSAAKTLLIFGEGKTERAFTGFLKKVFVERNSGVRITIDYGNGGSPTELLKKVRGKLQRRSFDDCVVMMDTDLPWPASRPPKINKTRIHYVGSKPCIEGTFLKLLNDPNYQGMQGSSAKCKRYFHKNYLKNQYKLEIVK